MAGYIGSRAVVATSGVERKKTFAITTTTTSLTGLDYTPNHVHVFHNGIRLVDGTDYTATNGTSITLVNAAENGDEVVVVSYGTFSPADTYTKTEADDRYVNASGDTIPNGLEIRSDTLSTAPIIASNGFDGDQFQIKQPNRGGHFGWQCSGTNSENYVVIDRQRSNEVLSIHGTQNHILRTNNTDRLTIDSAGRVSMPYQPAFSAWINTLSSSVASGGVIPFNATIFNNGYFNTSTYAFTAPITGYYVFGATLADDDATEFQGKIATFYKNGTVYRDILEGETGNAVHWETHAGTFAYMNAGDTMDVRMRSGSVTLNNGSDGYPYRCSFYGYLIG